MLMIYRITIRDTGVWNIPINFTGDTIAGLDAAGFEQAAQEAEHFCPVSNALLQNVAIRLHVHLAA
jgi:hypothetical protein